MGGLVRAYIIISLMKEDSEEELVAQEIIDIEDENYLRKILDKIRRDLEYTIYKAMLCYHANTLELIMRCNKWLSGY